MAKPWHPAVNRFVYNSPNRPKRPGSGGVEEGVALADAEEGDEPILIAKVTDCFCFQERVRLVYYWALIL